MSARRFTVSRLLMLLLVALFLARAATGWIAGLDETRGRRLSAAGRLAQAIPRLERAAIGGNRASTRWLLGEARLGLYQVELARQATQERLDELLVGAFRDETEAISRSPASGWSRASLADVYHQQERRQIYRYGLPLDMVGQDRWAFVGRPGRVAIGLLRSAIDHEPTQYLFYDQLVFVLFDYGLLDAGMDVVRQSALVQPDFGQHEYTRLDPIPAPLLDAFAEASREALGQVPLMQRIGHLLALGKLELRRGNPAQAEKDLRAALELAGTRLNFADARFHLGLALKSQSRNDDANEFLIAAQEEPAFRPASFAVRAAIAEEQGRLDEALSLMRNALRLRPSEITYLLDYARMAVEFGRFEWAEESLEWASMRHPSDPRPLRQLEQTLLEQGKTHEADEVRSRILRLEGPPPVAVEPPDS